MIVCDKCNRPNTNNSDIKSVKLSINTEKCNISLLSFSLDLCKICRADFIVNLNKLRENYSNSDTYEVMLPQSKINERNT